MNTTSPNSGRSGSLSKDLRKHYGPGALKWSVLGVLPQVGIALIESAELSAAAMVANDIGSCLLRPLPWGGRAVLHGPAVQFDADGNGHVIDSPEWSERFPKLGMTDAHAWDRLPDEIDDRGGARLVIVHLRDPDALANSDEMMGQIFRFVFRSQCCVALVAGKMSESTGKLLRDFADSVLHVEPIAGTRLGRIVQTKGRGALGEWQYTASTPFLDDGEPTIDDVREVRESEVEAARVH